MKKKITNWVFLYYLSFHRGENFCHSLTRIFINSLHVYFRYFFGPFSHDAFLCFQFLALFVYFFSRYQFKKTDNIFLSIQEINLSKEAFSHNIVIGLCIVYLSFVYLFFFSIFKRSCRCRQSAHFPASKHTTLFQRPSDAYFVQK